MEAKTYNRYINYMKHDKLPTAVMSVKCFELSPANHTVHQVFEPVLDIGELMIYQF